MLNLIWKRLKPFLPCFCVFYCHIKKCSVNVLNSSCLMTELIPETITECGNGSNFIKSSTSTNLIHCLEKVLLFEIVLSDVRSEKRTQRCRAA